MSDEGPAADDVLSVIADELYGGSPADFTARRTARADQVKRDGDAALAATIRGWRKPSVGAWLVNQLARARPGDLDALVELGEELRAAQAAMDGTLLRALAKRRVEVLRDLDAAAADLADAAGQGMSDAIQRQVQSTLQAALADPQAAEAVRAGHLAGALEVTGFGSVDLGDAVVVPIRARNTPKPQAAAAAPAKPSAHSREQAAAERAAAKERLAAARAEAADATAAAGRARSRWKDSESALTAAQARVATQQARVVERERALEQARADADAAEEAVRQAQAERVASEGELQQARARREAAETALRELETPSA